MNLSKMNEEGDHNSKLVLTYLHLLHKSLQILKLSTNSNDSHTHTQIPNEYQHTNVEKYMDSIARGLLLVCDPKMLSLPIPQHNFTYFDKHHNDVVARMKLLMRTKTTDNQRLSPTNTSTTGPTSFETRPKVLSTRKDILRNIFYNMAPIAYDLSSHVASIVARSIQSQSSTDSNCSTSNCTVQSTDASSSLSIQSFIMFSFWIQQAPQIAPIVTDLFRLAQFTSPFDHALLTLDCDDDLHHMNALRSSTKQDFDDCKMDIDPDEDDYNHDNNNNNDMEIDQIIPSSQHTTNENENIQKHILIPIEELAIICEAAHKVVEYYTNIDEVSSLKSWWDWSKLYTLLGYQNQIPCFHDSDNHTTQTSPTKDNFLTYDPNDAENSNLPPPIPNYGYATPNRTYDYHLACKWFVGRVIAHLLCLTGTSKGIYLDKLNIRHEFVPWMTHPWIIIEEREQFQNLAMRKVMCFTFLESNNECHDGDEEERMMYNQDNDRNWVNPKHCPFLLNNVTIDAPTPLQIRNMVTLHPSLVNLGNGVLLPRRNPVSSSLILNTEANIVAQDEQQLNQLGRKSLIITPTTAQNLELLGTALSSDPYPPPILVCGPRGSGKSSLIREIAHLCSATTQPNHFMNQSNNNSNNNGDNNLLEIHVDEETDSKTLLGSYAATDIPGEFTWQPGALTTAVRKGKWILLEDVENCPIEIQAALVKLFEERVLPLGVGKNEKCHPDFRMFGTCTTASLNDSLGESGSEGQRKRRSVLTAGSGGKRVLHPGLWRKVHVEPLPYSELIMLSRELYPSLPTAVSFAVMKVFRLLDKSGRTDLNSQLHSAINNGDEHEHLNEIEEGKGNVEEGDEKVLTFGSSGRHASVRDLVKLLGRISKTVSFEPGVTYCTESQRILCMAECFDVFIGWNPCREERRDFATRILAKAWGLSPTAVKSYIEDRQPPIKVTRDLLEVGRCTICCPQRRTENKGSNFADTNYALRLMEAAGISISLNEPTLLVGETGCGKTTLLQRLASLSGHELVVQNLSLQTDSTDLLGGYRPLEIRHIARIVYTEFVDLFISCFSKSQNAQFLEFVTAAYEKGQWKKLSQCFRRAAKMGLDKVQKRKNRVEQVARWMQFKLQGDKFEKQRIACDTGLAFAFTEGALIDAIRQGKWVLLDEINLASSETLQRLCGLLDDSIGSVTLTEKGDSEAICRHPDFRLFAAMNPATDAGKKDLPSSLRARFTELYVDELLDKFELRIVAGQYLNGAVTSDGPIQNSRSVIKAVDVYLKCRQLAEKHLIDGAGQRPRYTLRTMCRSLSAARCLVVTQKISVQRAILEGFELGFEGTLNASSRSELRKLLFENLGDGLSKKQLDHPGRRPGSRNEEDGHTLVKPFWLKTGGLEQIDYSKVSHVTHNRFVLTPSMLMNLRRISRSIACGPWPILLEGPTSAGKTSIIEYLAARCGHKCVRINNHEHTDVQEYTGSYTSDENGKLCFSEGILVQALRRGYWVILDELNLAPSEVLEALNRLLDDNRELYLSEINEVVKPHENFRLFATQNPSGAYGGRKPLSRAFRNRFVEINVGGIPDNEMVTILEQRCKCRPSYAKLLVKIMSALRKRRSKSSIFRGQDGLITPRDLLRWALRKFNSKEELAIEGFMLLAERLRNDDEKLIVQQVIEEVLKVEINCDKIYYGSDSHARTLIAKVRSEEISSSSGLTPQSIAPTKSLLRILTLVDRCVQQKEPVLLVGDTGCGKTTVVQLISLLLKQKLQIVNCHANTETSDLLGGLRPLRGRQLILESLIEEAVELMQKVTEIPLFNDITFPEFLHLSVNRVKVSFPLDAAQQIDHLVTKIQAALTKTKKLATISDEVELVQCEKKRKLCHERATKLSPQSYLQKDIMNIISRIKEKLQQYHSLFEWVDGPLVSAMKDGDMFLLDEMSLAEDAVLERLNSVLEPSRTLTLAEKGGDIHAKKNDGGSLINACDSFRIFATMNPGGDFGKRELSPALRSRFTEIWVPAVTDSADIDLVLEQMLLSSTIKNSFTSHESLAIARKKMLEYVNWFNNDICANPSSTLADFSLSLRDILAWAKFIVDTRAPDNGISLWAAYVHGASLMHLDGLGLGTGLAQDAADSTKMQARHFLNDQVPRNECEAGEVTQKHNDSCFAKHLGVDKFGINPFFIQNGPNVERQSNGFEINAPTTALNLMRVLRAMQIRKPILLEGSPGVGKTSLISALAAMSGHSLVRINLSEQTDITDLMGSDLPVPEDSNENTGASFQWCDGALLRAIKNGDWVLLDELNLASQSVLEGLNSCLDHRACVYIPELGETFECPPSFRIFAAQNPLAQGGGRKGLPKSFLNRFTKVYVEALSEEDLRDIVISKFPMIPSRAIEKMVRFNCIIQKDIDDRKFGQLGSPWEFNLRDVFRWCQLVSEHFKVKNEIDCGIFAEAIYVQRLRSNEDRTVLRDIYQECFGESSSLSRTLDFSIHPSHILVGNAAVTKNKSVVLGTNNMVQNGKEPHAFRTHFRSMESILHCVNMNWPCLIVGQASSGKSTLLKLAADFCNVKLEEVVLTPSSDVNELIGGFEQIDAAEVENRLLQSMTHIIICANIALVHSSTEVAFLQKLNTLYAYFQKHSASESNSQTTQSGLRRDDILTIAKGLLNTVVLVTSKSQSFKKLSKESIQSVQSDLTKLEKAKGQASTVQFRWVDGVLVQALEKGYWLHLENVNLCSSSVLDRLNPLMEPDGVLVLTECGIKGENSKGQSRIVKPHPNFRLFLSTNPSHGEVSRAMRNRCIEISLISPPLPKCHSLDAHKTKILSNVEAVDILDVLQQAGIASSALANYLVMFHVKDSTFDDGQIHGEPRLVKEWATMTINALNRGFVGHELSQGGQQVTYATQGNSELSCLPPLEDSDQMVHQRNVRHSLSRVPLESVIESDASLVKIAGNLTSNPTGLSYFGNHSINDLKTHPLDRFAPSLQDRDNRWVQLKFELIGAYIKDNKCDDSNMRWNYFDGYFEQMKKSIQYLVSKSRQMTTISNQYKHVIFDNRLFTILSEYELYDRASQTNYDLYDGEVSIAELSYCIFQNRIDRSGISCRIIPILHPLFLAIDTIMCSYLEASDVSKTGLKALEKLATCRDNLWMFLKTKKAENDAGMSWFHEPRFLVHWNWLKKSLSVLIASFDFDSTAMRHKKLNLELIISSIDKELLISGGDVGSLSNNFWKRIGHPIVPAKASDWLNLYRLRQDDSSSSVLTLDHFDFIHRAAGDRKTLSLADLIEEKHPCLSTASSLKLEILSAQCMAQWTSTDETSSTIRREKKNCDILNITKLVQHKIHSARESLTNRLHLHAVDATVHMDSNKLDVDDLEKLQGQCHENFDDDGVHVVEEILTSFGTLQMMPLVEYWCVKEEMWIVETITRFFNNQNNEGVIQDIQIEILPRIKRFIQVVINSTVWPVYDLRPFQTVLWALESQKASMGDFLHLFRCLYSTFIMNSAKHHWYNSFNDLTCVSDKLICPSFWNSGAEQKETVQLPPQNFGFDMGSARLKHDVITSCLFRLLGYNNGSTHSSKFPYLTLENHMARKSQAQQCLQFLCSDLRVLGKGLSSYNICIFFIKSIMEVLRDFFDADDDFSRLSSYILGHAKMEDKEVDRITKCCKNKKFQSIASRTLKPIASIMADQQNNECDEAAMALASVYVGLMSFHLLIPTSPLDPGTKPAAKAKELGAYMQILSSKMVSMRSQSGLSNGNFYPSTINVTTLIEEFDRVYSKKCRQAKKRVERPQDAPEFHHFVREVFHFADTIASCDNIIRLVNDIDRQTNEKNTSFTDMEINWQSSSLSFAKKVSCIYACYEDVASPFLAALGMVQNGIRSYSYHKVMSSTKQSTLALVKAQEYLLQYPNTSLHNGMINATMSAISDALDMDIDTESYSDSDRLQMDKLGKRSKFSFLLASISHLVLLKNVNCVDQSIYSKLSSSLFHSIAHAWELAGEQSSANRSDDSPDETEEERNERQFREQFPNHRKEFSKLIKVTEAAAAGEEFEDNMADSDDGDDELFVEKIHITDQESNLLAELHHIFYSGTNTEINDTYRAKTFHLMYSAGALLNHKITRQLCSQTESEKFNAHCLAIALNGSTHLNYGLHNLTHQKDSTDFHRDPNPKEVLKAYKPLQNLLHRVTQLLRAFPGNAILIATGQVLEMMLQLDLNKVPLGKMLTGLEVVLRKAQDWEQHASQRVSLGDRLRQVSRLVASWRKLELQSWSNLLNVRERQYIVNCRRHWMRLYLLLVQSPLENKNSSERNLTLRDKIPKWIWKGVASKIKNFTYGTKVIKYEDADTVEVLKALDSFILTAGIGHFKERLRLISSFANQLKEEGRQSFDIEREIKSDILKSFCEHYSKFVPFVNSTKDTLRKPIETKLKNEVKLAKWDEQSYYSLSESSEKSHMKLMMIVKEYDEVLQTSVGKLLEENFLRGIRTQSEVFKSGPTIEPTTEIPSNPSLFPLLQQIQNTTKASFSGNRLHADLRFCKPVRESTSSVFSKYTLNIPKYISKMSKIFPSHVLENGSIYAHENNETITSICETIFERIEVLREKGTKPMKQRALVDLFKLLKKQGFSSMKWSVPNEVRDMNSILQLPSPESSKLSQPHQQLINDCEDYFRRNTVELSRLRSEVTMIGSPYMSKREMELMTGFGDHGLLLLCQQRAVISYVVSELENIGDLLSGFNSIHNKLPKNQVVLSKTKSQLNDSYSSLLEMLQQTNLAMKTIASFNNGQGESFRDIIGTFAGCLSLLQDSYQPRFEWDSGFLTESHISEITSLRKHLTSVQDGIERCRTMSTDSLCLPTNFFKQCIAQIKRCIEEVELFEKILCEKKETHDDPTKITEFDSLISQTVQLALLAGQTLHDGSVKGDKQDEEEDQDDMSDQKSLWENHHNMLCEWDSLQLHKFNNSLMALKEFLIRNSDHAKRHEFHHYTINVSSLVVKVMDICHYRLVENLKFCRNVAKFEYIQLRIFRALVSKGFCADDVEDGGDGEGDAGNMNFEDDVDGTGMGEGDGKNDVTDEIENEEQLLGLKGDEKEEKSTDQKELGEEEAETGMEMENEFDGELFDVPDKKEDDNEVDNDDDEEELDREMGDGSDPNEQVVDEKMWDEDDDEEEGQQEEEKFEKDSKMTGESVQDEMRTKEEDEGDDNGKEGDEKAQGDAEDQKEDDSSPTDERNDGGKGDEEEDMVNDDLEDNYEDQHVGVDVRNDEDEQEENNEMNDDDEEMMDLDNDMNLDDGDNDENADETQGDGNDIDKEDENSEENQDETAGAVDLDNDESNNHSEDENETDAEGIQNSHQSLADDDQHNQGEENENDNEDQEEDDEDNVENNDLTNSSEQQYPEAQGVAASSGADKIKEVEDKDEEDGDEDDGGGDDNEDRNGGGEEQDTSESNPGAGGQSNDASGDFQNGPESSKSESKSASAMDAPNPFRDPGDAEKFWHRKLDMIKDNMDGEQDNEDSATKAEDNNSDDNDEPPTPENKDSEGTFEFTSNDQDHTTQVLGGVEDEEVVKLDETNKNENDPSNDNGDPMNDEEAKPPLDEGRKNSEPPKSSISDNEEAKKSKSSQQHDDDADNDDNDDDADNKQPDIDMSQPMEEDPNIDDEEVDQENKVMTDLAQLQMDEHQDENNNNAKREKLMEFENHEGITLEEAEQARKKWSQLSAETNSLSRRMCEKLRLVMEPLVASKLRGDYRTGKRINMKRVIGYIASGYRKDKIWLRRTKPGKRDYRVLVAVDNSESMKSGAGEVALMALATLATGMSQLEVGELGVASFGEEMKLLHPFHAPFTSSSGADVVSNFKFNDKRTRTALCVESAMAALSSDANGGSSSSSMQLVFMISDGRIERDSREDLRRLVREMTERSILLVMIIVEGDRDGNMKMKDSIVNMKEVSFQNGKPKLKHFIDDYPFPYYMILQDMNTLPEVLGDALKQWFEMMVQNK